jgi:sugar phosphate isomerase/epimerase
MKGRVKILHLKDMKRTPEGPTYAEIGVGNINFNGIIETAKNIGVEYFIVEQDKCDGDPIDSARISCEFLRKIL